MDFKNPQQVMDEVTRIAGISNNAVAAHAAEDNLYYGIILAIANGAAENAQTMCQKAIKSQNVKFVRSYHAKTEE